jgi:hypothetical protein
MLLTCVEQSSTDKISVAVKQEITQGLLERHGSDSGVTVGCSCCFYDFETCEEIKAVYMNVRFLPRDDVA